MSVLMEVAPENWADLEVSPPKLYSSCRMAPSHAVPNGQVSFKTTDNGECSARRWDVFVQGYVHYALLLAIPCLQLIR